VITNFFLQQIQRRDQGIEVISGVTDDETEGIGTNSTGNDNGLIKMQRQAGKII